MKAAATAPKVNNQPIKSEAAKSNQSSGNLGFKIETSTLEPVEDEVK